LFQIHRITVCHGSSHLLLLAAVEHKIETLVAAPAAVEEALASLIVDNQDKYHALQYRALVTYVKRVYHPFLMCEPQVRLCTGAASTTCQTPTAAAAAHASLRGVALCLKCLRSQQLTGHLFSHLAACRSTRLATC
jgi:iron-sulfur cluster repair protein YtfE (RIC family)